MKVQQARESNMGVVYCVGEDLPQYEAEKT